MHSPITPADNRRPLVEHWLRHLRLEARLDSTTINEYERVLRRLHPALGEVGLGELTTERINVVLAELGTESLNFQRKTKVVTGAMLDTAVEFGALTVNPVRGSLSISRPEPEHRSLTASELETVRVAVRAWLSQGAFGAEVVG